MNKKDIIKAFFTGAFSLFPFYHGFSEFRGIDVEESILKPAKSTIPEVKVELMPVMEDVGRCFDAVGALIRDAMGATNVEQG